MKGSTYDFNKHSPFDIQLHDKSSRIAIGLKTACRIRAKQAARSIAQRLEDYWMSLRLANLDIPAFYLLRSEPQRVSQSSCMILTEALELYLRLKGVHYACARCNTDVVGSLTSK